MGWSSWPPERLIVNIFTQSISDWAAFNCCQSRSHGQQVVAWIIQLFRPLRSLINRVTINYSCASIPYCILMYSGPDCGVCLFRRSDKTNYIPKTAPLAATKQTVDRKINYLFYEVSVTGAYKSQHLVSLSTLNALLLSKMMEIMIILYIYIYILKNI